ncbi:Nucleoside 5-triphosphatase RdgB (dHAPTP, dITP, XTP-specific) [Nitrincola lacisaponensis]|uniref:dITP/XTP pyrophosphatase n=1 Tax=Nitrincola lacisaponensis TaxID=267850 RepID=A0A063Y371_9GAMM|nr:RdgB/HAM1 family non-canonical purine NTP pyrophosphatase [Nitrincola lacisaponensis]KDE40129.1 Nucleoside 5-triphosphatase RdgB (dHAPTP, dITP, XTP-specific) [Nitrincola lacisaponensis]
MSKQFVLASGNAGKLREFGQMLSSQGIKLLPQSAFQVSEAEETGLTFVENAILKARHASQATGLPALADDSGLEVDALKGAPGIYSARYAGQGAGDEANIDKLLTALDGIPEAERTGRYQCVLVYMRHALDPTPLICQASWEGVVLTERRGQGGFGYDPIFYIPALQASVAELSAEQKHLHGHRGKAMRAFFEQLHLLLPA